MIPRCIVARAGGPIVTERIGSGGIASQRNSRVRTHPHVPEPVIAEITRPAARITGRQQAIHIVITKAPARLYVAMAEAVIPPLICSWSSQDRGKPAAQQTTTDESALATISFPPDRWVFQKIV